MLQKRTPKYTSLLNMGQYYTSMYYRKTFEDPEIRPDIDRNKELAEEIDSRYRSELTNKYPQWNTPENMEAVRDNLEFLAQPWSRYEKREQIRERQQLLQQSAKEKGDLVDRYLENAEI